MMLCVVLAHHAQNQRKVVGEEEKNFVETKSESERKKNHALMNDM